MEFKGSKTEANLLPHSQVNRKREINIPTMQVSLKRGLQSNSCYF